MSSLTADQQEQERILSRQREDYEVSVIIGTNMNRNDHESNSLKRSIELGKISNTILSTCNNPKCEHENNMTENKSVYCEMCGMLLTNRHY